MSSSRSAKTGETEWAESWKGGISMPPFAFCYRWPRKAGEAVDWVARPTALRTSNLCGEGLTSSQEGLIHVLFQAACEESWQEDPESAAGVPHDMCIVVNFIVEAAKQEDVLYQLFADHCKQIANWGWKGDFAGKSQIAVVVDSRLTVRHGGDAESPVWGLEKDENAKEGQTPEPEDLRKMPKGDRDVEIMAAIRELRGHVEARINQLEEKIDRISSTVGGKLHELRNQFAVLAGPKAGAVKSPEVFLLREQPQEAFVELKRIEGNEREARRESQDILNRLEGEPITEGFVGALKAFLSEHRWGIRCSCDGRPVAAPMWRADGRYAEGGYMALYHTVSGKTETHGCVTVFERVTLAERPDLRRKKLKR